MFDIFKTHNLIAAVEQLKPVSSFLRDRYFPTNDATDVFSTDDVLVEYKDGDKTLAPFVAPRSKGVTLLRKGYTMERYTPPCIKPKRGLTIDDLQKKGFGEALYSNLTPEDRQNVLVVKDLDELSKAITRREEVMAAETMLNNGCVMKHIADDEKLAEEKEIRFYTGDNNPAVYTPTTAWDEVGANILGDLEVMIRMLTSKGLRAEELVCAPDVADTIIHNAAVKELLDIRNYNLGSIAPTELAPGASIVGVLNVLGRNIKVISYDETYTDDEGNDVAYIPEGKCILTAPAAGRTLYGAVTQIEQADGLYHTYTGRRIPKYVSNAEGDTRSLTVTSHPLMIPNNKNPFIVATVA